jgi:hypothetical protein
MRAKTFLRSILFCSMVVGSFCCGESFAGQTQAVSRFATSRAESAPDAARDAQQPRTSPLVNQIIERTIARERQEAAAIAEYTPIIETYIQEVKPDKELGTIPRSDFYFLGQADLRDRLKVHSMIERGRSGSWLWSFEPGGFLQMVFIDRGEFDRAHYQFKYAGRDFLGDVRCFVFDLSPVPKARGARFVGRIWVEDQGYTVVRFNGMYTPGVHFFWHTLQEGYYLHFDSWRTNVKSGLWLPSYIYSQELGRPGTFSGPQFKGQTRIWGYRLTSATREEELSRLLVESSNPVNDDATQHDRSPLEAQREWRHEAENNVLDALERDGILAPPGPVDKILNTIVNNLEITNNLEGLIDLHCRVLLTSSLEMFSVENTIVLSRGLIDVVPDEATLASLIAQEMADALMPKAYQDQYGFSDVLRYSPTEILKHLSFKDDKTETVANSQKAMELLQKSPYAAKLGQAGLFLEQLHAESKELNQLISPRLGNQVFLASQLLQSAPALQRNSKDQIAALPMGSRIKLDAWSATIDLMKSKPVTLLSARDKMPFEITPLVPYLTRYVESSDLQTAPGPALTQSQ